MIGRWRRWRQARRDRRDRIRQAADRAWHDAWKPARVEAATLPYRAVFGRPPWPLLGPAAAVAVAGPIVAAVRQFYDVAEATASAKIATYSWSLAQEGITA